MPDEYNQSQRIEHVAGNSIYNKHEHYYPAPPPLPAGPRRWGILGSAVATLLLGGTLVATKLNARVVYYCASHNSVKYHTDATCKWLKQCGSEVKSLPLSKARSKMEPCKLCP